MVTGLVLVARARSCPGRARWPRTIMATGLAVAGGVVLWRAANEPGLTWFGPVASHGPRDRGEVAITFDDGPDPTWTPQVARILADHDAKATFFLVGKALDRWPAVARRLDAEGHLLANHSYHHDSWRWLDPRYPELDRTEDAFHRHLHRCPALYRPPHGQRTPFVLQRARDAGLRTVTWDVSAQDWSDDDGARVARRILDQVEPGSIILLHDGIDGNGTADRTAVVEALPLILDGLEARHLQPVRLDRLLDTRAYLPRC
jgi:peptidoglycan/xylan/chitin deacetylase (PgdA/CDA1 family)